MNNLEKETKLSLSILMVRRFFRSQLQPSCCCSSPFLWAGSPGGGNELALSFRQYTLNTLFSLHSVIRPSSQKPFSFLYNYIPFPYSFQVWLISRIFPHFCCLLPWLILVGSVSPPLWGPDNGAW